MQKVLRILTLLFTVLLSLAPARPTAAENALAKPAATAAGIPAPALLKDIYTADDSSDPRSFYAVGDKFLYIGADPAGGQALWASDGTADGTRILNLSQPAGEKSFIAQFVPFQGQVFFTVHGDEANGYETSSTIWSTNGTPAGTALIYKIGSSSIYSLVALGDWLYFSLSDGRLMRYGGSGNFIEQVSPAGFSIGYQPLTVLNGRLFFDGWTEATGRELWRYDPARGEFALVKDICPDICQSYEYAEAGSLPNSLTAAGDTLYFEAIADAAQGYALWASDGSEAGTRFVKDIYPGEWSGIYSRTPAGSWLYFVADDGAHGEELWRSDGTPENTTLVADLAPGAISANPQFLTAMDSGGSLNLFFSARDGLPGVDHGVELWKVPVTPAGTSAVPVLLEIAPGPASSRPVSLSVIGGALYFAAQDTPGDSELWKSDGSPETTARVADLVPGPDGSAPTGMAAWGEKLVFSAVDALHGREPWICDGSDQSCALIGNMAYTVYAAGSSPETGLLTQVGGQNIRYFSARDPLHGRELWRSDGTPDGTWLVKDLNPGQDDGMDSPMVEVNHILYFYASDEEYSISHLWRSDGTPDGTWMVKDLAPGQPYLNIYQLTAVGDKLYFIADDPLHGDEIWASDGTEAGTHLLKEIVPGTGGLWDARLAALGDQLIFTFKRDAYSSEVEFWRSDGTDAGTRLFLGPYTFTYGSIYLMPSAGIQGRLYFSMPDPALAESGLLLWYTDGTAAGTKRVTATGDDEYWVPELLVPAGGYLYFIAYSSESGWYHNFPTLWRMPLGGSAASKLMVFYPEPRYLGLSDSSTLMYLGTDDYNDEDYWVAIDAISGKVKSACPYNCYPQTISSYAPWLGSMYFAAGGSDTLPGGLWVTDGSAIGTAYISIPTTGLNFTSVDHFLSAGNALYFSADDDLHGNEPWIIRVEQNNRIYIPSIQR